MKILKAIEKQKPKSYTMKRAWQMDYRNGDNGQIVKVYTMHCPSCNTELADTDWDGLPTKDWAEYCSVCGQRIDWLSDVNIPDDPGDIPERILPIKIGEITA